MELIDKAAVVAELIKRIDDYWNNSENTMGIYPYALEEVIKYINTLEAKDVDEIIKTAEDHAYFAGSETMREKIMAKSVDAVVSQVPCINEIVFRSPHTVRKYSNIVTDMMELGLEKGDLVKLIVVKTQKGE